MLVVTLAAAAYLGFSLVLLGHDKAIHYATFLALTAEFYMVFDTQHKLLRTVRLVTFIVCTVICSVVLEIIQPYVNPKRIFDLKDIVANVTGSLTGLALCSGYDYYTIRRLRANRYLSIRQDPEIQMTDIGETGNDRE